MHEHGSARQALTQMILHRDLEGLLGQAEAFHGHRCPMLALGVKAGQYAMHYLQQQQQHHGHGHGHGHSHGPILEEVMAVVESNNCFADGIQVVTGCTLGNNSLIIKDLGKTAVTVIRKSDGKAVRLAVWADFRKGLFARYPVAEPLFEKVMVQREATEEERHRFQHLWEAMARRELEVPLEEQFAVTPLTMKAPLSARSLEVKVCSRCGEGMLAAKVKEINGQNLCLACAGEGYYLLGGQGIEIFSQ